MSQLCVFSLNNYDIKEEIEMGSRSSSKGVQDDINIFSKFRKLTEIFTNSDGQLCSGGSSDLEKDLSTHCMLNKCVTKCDFSFVS